MLLNVESVKATPSGKSLVVKAGGKDYFAKTASGIQAGMTIEAETKDSEFKGKTNTWIEKYRQVGTSNAAPQSQPSSSASQSGAAGAAPIWANFVSNQVAHAIQSGCINDPAQIKVWAAAAKQAFVELL